MQYTLLSTNGGKIHIADPIGNRHTLCGLNFYHKSHTEHFHTTRPDCKRCLAALKGQTDV